jgi:hypothetical protein
LAFSIRRSNSGSRMGCPQASVSMAQKGNSVW